MCSRRILEFVDHEKARRWLQSVCRPTLVIPDFFEQMGFPSWFVPAVLQKTQKSQMRGQRSQGRSLGVLAK